MKSLPDEYVPAKGTPGALWRIQQYTTQLPAYDFDSGACHQMTDLEKRRLIKFAEKRRSQSEGRGRVSATSVDAKVQMFNRIINNLVYGTSSINSNEDLIDLNIILNPTHWYMLQPLLLSKCTMNRGRLQSSCHLKSWATHTLLCIVVLTLLTYSPSFHPVQSKAKCPYCHTLTKYCVLD